jgi:hypothetical protein
MVLRFHLPCAAPHFLASFTFQTPDQALITGDSRRVAEPEQTSMSGQLRLVEPRNTADDEIDNAALLPENGKPRRKTGL